VRPARSEKMTAAAAVPRWDWLRLAVIVACLFGIFVAGYMTWAEVTGNETVCANTGAIDCAAVQQSAYAKTFGIPVAMMGLLGYIAILGVIVLEDQIDMLAAYGRTLVVGMALFGVIFQTYLTYVEASVLGKWCQWCMMSYAVIAVVLILGGYRLYGFLKPLRQ
jgi:uncharacterized membrane protein